jgi:hypothetical protein
MGKTYVQYSAYISLQGFVNTYPDIRMEHLVNLLLIRGDMNRTEARQV